MVMTFGEKLKGMRVHAGLTQEELASKLGLSRQMIQAYEQGKSKPGESRKRDFRDALGEDGEAIEDLFAQPKSAKEPVDQLQALKENFDLKTQVLTQADEIRDLRQKLNSFERIHHERYLYDKNTWDLTQWIVEFVEGEVEAELGEGFEFKCSEALESAIYQELATTNFPENIKPLVTEHPEPLDLESYDSYHAKLQVRQVTWLFDKLNGELRLEQALENGWALSAIEPIARRAAKSPEALAFLRHMCEPGSEMTPSSARRRVPEDVVEAKVYDPDHKKPPTKQKAKTSTQSASPSDDDPTRPGAPVTHEGDKQHEGQFSQRRASKGPKKKHGSGAS